MVSRVAAEEALGCAIAPTWGTVRAFAFVIVVVGVVAASAAVAPCGCWVQFAERGPRGVAQHVAASALDEPRAVACNDEFDRFAEHKDTLLCGGFDDGVRSVYDGD